MRVPKGVVAGATRERRRARLRGRASGSSSSVFAFFCGAGFFGGSVGVEGGSERSISVQSELSSSEHTTGQITSKREQPAIPTSQIAMTRCQGPFTSDVRKRPVAPV